MLRHSDESILTQRSRDAFTLLRTIMRDLRMPYIVFFLTTLVFAGASFLLPQFLLMFTETAAKISEVSIADFIPRFLLLGLAVAAGLALTTFANTFLREWFQLKVERYLRTRVLARLHHMSMAEIDDVQRGDWLTSVTNDLRNVERFLAESLPGQLRSLLIVLGTGGLFIYYSQSMALVPIIACALIAVVNVWVQKHIAPLLHEIRDLHGDLVQSLLQSLEGIKTVRSYGAEADQTARFSQQLITVERKGLRVARAFGMLLGSNDAATQILTTLSLTFIMLMLSKGELSLAAALAYPFYLSLFYSSAETLAGATLDWTEFFVSGGRFAAITREESAPAHTGVDATLIQNAVRVTLKKISFGFSEDDPLHSSYDFSVQKHELVTLVGPSGAGKSTFLEVLSGLRPPFSGQWLIETADNKQEAAFADSPLPHTIATYVEQKPYIFEGTVLDNLRLGDSFAEADIWDVLSDVNLATFISENGGLSFFLRDAGQNLSVGQRYRLALARALLRKRPLLLLDEPFAALDQSNVELINDALQKSKARCGVVIVSHIIPETLKPDRVIQFAPTGMNVASPRVSKTRELSGINPFEEFEHVQTSKS